MSRYYKDLFTSYHKIYTFDNGNSLYLGNKIAIGWTLDNCKFDNNYFSKIKNNLKSNNIKNCLSCVDIYCILRYYMYLPFVTKNNSDIYMINAYLYIDHCLKYNSIIVCCDDGCNKSAFIVINYLAKKLNISFEESYKIVLEKRSCIKIDKNLLNLNIN
jgi:hypothetical protein